MDGGEEEGRKRERELPSTNSLHMPAKAGLSHFLARNPELSQGLYMHARGPTTHPLIAFPASPHSKGVH